MGTPTPVDNFSSDNEALEETEKEVEELDQLTVKQNSQLKLKPQVEPGAGGDADDFDVWVKSRQLIKPEDQLELTEADLSEEITKVLTQTNTNQIENLVVYSFKESAFIPLPPAGNTVTLLEIEGTALHIDSEEAKRQIEETGEMGYPLPAPRVSFFEGDDPRKGKMTEQQSEMDVTEGAAPEDGEEEEEPPEGDGEAEETEEAEEDDKVEGEEAQDAQEAQETEEGEGPQAEDTQAIVPGKKRKLINQFNFCERAALTYTNPKRNVETQTIPPPRSQFGGTVLQWIIYDTYAQDFSEQQAEHQAQQKEKPHDNKRHSHVVTKHHPKENKTLQAEVLNKKYLKCWQILERMINQNIFDEIANDYRYWEDPADEFREGEGTLLPLWKFQYDRTRKMNITDLVFNPHYYDLFAVCYGSYDFMKQPNEGCVCFFTIKNPSYPDYIIMTESGVMCCDIHTKYPYLVVIGMYDGNVAVYNLKDDLKKPLYLSVGVKGKHSENVWMVKWGMDMADGEINFFSISSSGHIFNWVLMQNKLAITTVITLLLEIEPIEGPDGTALQLKSCGSCMQFHPTDHEIFLVGTEKGLIYKCSTAYSSKYLITYDAHYLSVYRIDYNRFNSNIFISCSADWRVKVWEDMRPEPLFIFDLGSAVGDVRWAPYSSTVFAAVTNEGKVFVYDLNVNKYRAICIQAVVPKRKNKLTRLAFNEKLPFIIVGDDKGTVTSLKLSPNLRLMVKPPKKQLYLDQHTLQVQKLEKLLSLVRELPEGELIKDTATTVQS